MTDTSSTGFLATLEATIETDWAKVVSFLKVAEGDVISFLGKVASGAEILVEDIEAAAQYVIANLSTINATVATVASAANVIAPGNATVAKVVADLQTGVNDVGLLAQSLQTGNTTGDPAVVTTAVNAVAAVKQLGSLASTASGTLAQLANASTTATQSVSPPTPNEG